MNKPKFSTNERAEFSERLRTALGAAKMHPTSPTHLSRAFNVIHAGKPVSVHAARKWLVGDAIPTQEKLRDLAMMLGVSLQWLRFGDSNDGAVALGGPIYLATWTTMAALDALSTADQALVADFIRMLRSRAKAADLAEAA